MDLLADEFDLSPPALTLLAAYDDAVKTAAEAAAEAAKTVAAGADDAAGAAGEDLGEGDAAPPTPAPRVAGVPRLADPGEEETGGRAADLHGVLLAAGALDVDLSDVATGVRYTVTRTGRGLLKKAA